MSLSELKKKLTNFHRRKRPIESYEWWNHLNYAQKFAVSSLYKFGYHISFVRSYDGISVVVMELANSLVSVNKDGLIDANPNIQLRRS